jgi:hypothetical protein
MHIYALKCEMLAKCSLQQTFEVFEDPYNLARINAGVRFGDIITLLSPR